MYLFFKIYELFGLVTDTKGNPIANKRVDWEVVEGDGYLQDYSTLTYTGNSFYDEGEARNFLYFNTTETNEIKASVYGYNKSTTFNVNKSH